ncbi:unnamed protein product [Schistosoma bovis]|nr:unnamed protein product [Schistosoma bovis]
MSSFQYDEFNYKLIALTDVKTARQNTKRENPQFGLSPMLSTESSLYERL